MGKGKNNKIISIGMALILFIVSIPCFFMNITSVKAVDEQAGSTEIKEIMFGTTALSTDSYTKNTGDEAVWDNENGKKIYLGIAPQVDDASNYKPMPFRVLPTTATDRIFIDSDVILAHFNKSADTTPWASSIAGNWMENTYYGGEDFFSSTEKSIILKTTISADERSCSLADGVTYTFVDMLSSYHIFPLNVEEIYRYYESGDERMKGGHYYLRSHTKTSEKYATVHSNGNVAVVASTDDKRYIRMSPAMNISTDKIAFTKAYSYSGTNFDKINSTTQKEWTLAIHDSNSSFHAERVNSYPITVKRGGTFWTEISDSSGTVYEQTSGMLVDAATGEVLYYGKMTADGENLVKATIPTGLPEGEYVFYVFGENPGEQGRSSYVSNINAISFNVENLFELEAGFEGTIEGFYVSGDCIQSNVLEINDIELIADDDYYFPEDYTSNILFKEKGAAEWDNNNTLEDYGISVTWVDYSRIKISGTLTNDLCMQLPLAYGLEETSMTFGEYNTTYTYGDPDFTITASAELAENEHISETPPYEIVYSSSDTTVAVADPATGKVTIKNSGSFYITASTGGGDYYQGKDISTNIITVLPKDLSNLSTVAFLDEDSHEYDGNVWKPNFSVKYGGNTMIEDVDYKVVYPDDCIEPGKKDFIIRFINKYTGDVTISGMINKTVVPEEPTTEEPTTEEPAVFVMPEITHIVKAQTGMDSYYITPLTLLAPEGYYISLSEDEDFGESITFFESAESAEFYLKDAATGLVSEPIRIPGFKIDAKTPDIQGISDGKTVYTDIYELTVSDDNLSALYINNEPVTITGNTMKIELSSNNGKEEYIIRATDKAGNEKMIKFFVAENWTKDNRIPSNSTVKLRSNQAYTLESGVWYVATAAVTADAARKIKLLV